MQNEKTGIVLIERKHMHYFMKKYITIIRKYSLKCLINRDFAI